MTMTPRLPNSTRRAGATLIEVLVAIFVMAIGLLALLTLFPLGALRMAQAIQDERTAQAAVSAHALSHLNLPNLVDPPPGAGPALVNPRFQEAWPLVAPPPGGLSITDPYKDPYPPGTQPPAWKGAHADMPSYPVFVDPVGFQTAPAGLPQQYSLASSYYMSRRGVKFAPGSRPDLIYRWFTLLDDIEFESDLTAGTPGAPRLLGAGSPQFNRDVRYSYALMCQRPRYGDPSVVNVSVVVYNKRPLSLTGSLSLPEYAYKTYFDPGNQLVTVDYSAAGSVPPPIRVGDWLLDTTEYKRPPVGGNVYGSAHANFYRVVGINEIADPTGQNRQLVQFEVQTPLRGFDNSKGLLTDPNYGYIGTCMVLEGVAEVFEKGPTRLP